MPEQDIFELRNIISVIRRWWWLILVFTLLAGITAFTYTSSLPPVYEANTILLIEPAKTSNLSDYTSLIVGERLALTYSEMLEGQPILDDVIAELDLQVTHQELANKITSTPIRDTQLIRLTSKGDSPSQAADLANMLAKVFIDHIQELNSLRYASALQNIENELQALSKMIEENQTQVEQQRSILIEGQPDLSRLESDLAVYRQEYRTLQQDYQALQLSVSENKENVFIVEDAHLTESDSRYLFDAMTTMFIGDQELLPTYTQILIGQSNMEETIEQTGLMESPEDLVDRISIEVLEDTNLILLTVTDRDPTQAVLLADTITGLFIAKIHALLEATFQPNMTRIETQLAGLSEQIEDSQKKIEALNVEIFQSEAELTHLESLLTENRNDYRALLRDYQELALVAINASESVVITEPAQLPTLPVATRRMINTLLALTSGAFIGIGLAFLIEYLDDTIKTPQDIKLILGLETIGTIPRIKNGKDELVALTQPRSPITEAFRTLRNNLRFSERQKPIRSVLLTSPGPHEGKSFIAANLAITIASSDIQVILVDADLHHPYQHILFQIEPGEGFSGSLRDGTTNGRLQSTELESLSVLTAGEELPPNPTGLLESKDLPRIFKQFNSRADFFLVDSPPILPVVDTAILASHFDGVLLVIEAGATRPAAAQQAIDQLKHVGANLLGVVLNGVPEQSFNYNYSYHGYFGVAENGRGRFTGSPNAFLSRLKRRFRKKLNKVES